MSCAAWRQHPVRQRTRQAPARQSFWKNRSWRFALGCEDAFEKSDKVLGDVIDMRGIAPLQLPGFAEDLAGMVRHDENRRHAERVRHREVAGEVVEYCRGSGIDAVGLEKAMVG